MRRLLRVLVLCGFLAGAVGLLLPPQGHAQAPAAGGDKVRFTSVDGVDLHGNFYASSKKSAPTVLILHAIGEDSRRKEYTELAKALQKEGYAVLTFDFRAHGQSKSVDPAEFWSVKYPNRRSVAGAPKDTIELRDIPRPYYNVFVNDIAAAKAFLDRKNDAGECNTSSLIVLGAESGATLGAIWINSEWYRYKLVPPSVGVVYQPDLKNSEGKNVICGVWLSISPDLGGRRIPLSSLVFHAGKEKKVPMVFLYNDGDDKDKRVAKQLESSIKGSGKKAPPGLEFTAAVAINAGPKLAGRELLKATGTDAAITDYLQRVAEAKGNEFREQEFRKSQYVWRMPSGQITQAKTLADQMLQFNGYNAFIPVR
jgi:hypothetical protein